MYKTRYEKERDNAKQEFEQLQFDDGKKLECLRQICYKTLDRYDAEIEWFDAHADRRRFGSGAIRFIAVLLGTASLTLINIRAFDTAFATNGFFGIQLSAIATALALVAGGILLLDTVFQVTPRYACWRVMEYTIRILRTTFEAEFNKTYGALDEDKIDRTVFNKAKILAIESFKNVEAEIKAETERWQQNLDSAMKTLQQKIDKTVEDVSKTAEEVSKKASEEEKARREKEEQEGKKKEPVGLEVTIAKEGARQHPLTLVVVNHKDTDRQTKQNASPGQKVSFSLIPGLYILRLLDKSGNEIISVSKRLKPENDETLAL